MSLLKFTFFSALVSLTTLAANDSNLYMNKSHQIGFGVSKYKYGEYDPYGIRKADGEHAMTMKATNISVDYSYVHPVLTQSFLKFDSRFAYAAGGSNYNGLYAMEATPTEYKYPATLKGEKNWYAEARAMFGTSIDVGSTVLSPYVGLGYRFLLNNDKGATFKVTDPDTGEIIIDPDAGGEMSGTISSSMATKRKQSYLYIPIGVIHKAALSAKTRLITNLEYDLFLKGKNTTSDSDGDSHYTQKKGYGARGSIMLEMNRISFGPFVHYWSVDNSDYSYFVQDNITYSSQEPKNDTVEYGLQVFYRF